MKQFIITTGAALIACSLSSQTIQEIATGAGYQRQSYVNLSTSTEKQVLNTAWDIAFTVYGQQDAGIFINESSGTTMGQPQPSVVLYRALTDNFADQPDPAALADFRLLNRENSWAYGAFNEGRNVANRIDFGWGQYNPPTNQVVGKAVYVIKLRDGSYRKIQIVSLTGTTYTFKYANLDGTNEQTKTINKADHVGKTLAYFSLLTGAVADVEPATGFDLLYCRYTTSLYDPAIMDSINYDLTGILHARGAQAAEAHGVNPETVRYTDYKDSLRSKLDVIGHDWKSFTGTGWSVDEKRVFFLKTAQGRVWKLHFIDFEGGSTGKSVLEKTDLGIISKVQDPAAIGAEVLLYPNPVTTQAYISLNLPTAWSHNEGLLTITDMQGRAVLRQHVALRTGFQVLEVNAGNWMPGAYTVTLGTGNEHLALGRLIRQ